MDNNNVLISIEGLVKRFPMGQGEFTALREISLTLRRGEFTGLVGPSGSGKTTLLNIVGSLDVPSGRLRGGRRPVDRYPFGPRSCPSA